MNEVLGLIQTQDGWTINKNKDSFKVYYKQKENKKGYYVGATRAKDDLILLASNRYRIPSWFERIPERKNGKKLYKDSNKQSVWPDINDLV